MKRVRNFLWRVDCTLILKACSWGGWSWRSAWVYAEALLELAVDDETWGGGLMSPRDALGVDMQHWGD